MFAKQLPAATQILCEFTRGQTALRALAKRPARATPRRFNSVSKAKRIPVNPAAPEVTGDQTDLRKNPSCFRTFEGGSVVRVIVAEEDSPADKFQKLSPEKDRNHSCRVVLRVAELIQPGDF